MTIEAASARERVVVDALAAGIAGDAARSTAMTLATSLTTLEANGWPLGELQAAELIEAAIRRNDGFERRTAERLADALAGVGVASCGVPEDDHDGS